MTNSDTKLMKVICRHCRKDLSHPLRAFTSDDPIRLLDHEAPFDPGLISSVQEFRCRAGGFLYKFPADWIVNNASVINCTATDSTFGCCGCTPKSEPNLMCKCGSMVGFEWSDCLDVRFTIFENMMVGIVPVSSPSDESES